MTPRELGNAFVATWILLAVVYDCWVHFVLREPAATISDTLRSWVQWSLLVLVPLGGLLWHLFGVRRGLGPPPLYGWAPFVVLIAGMVLYALWEMDNSPNIGP
jgi:hypothetical protein